MSNSQFDSSLSLKNLRKVARVVHFPPDYTVALEIETESNKGFYTRLNMARADQSLYYDDKESGVDYPRFMFLVHLIQAITGRKFELVEETNQIRIYKRTRKRFPERTSA